MRSLVIGMILVGLFVLSGCETTKGVVGGATLGAASGAQKDWKTFKEIDAWMRKNLW